MNAETVDAGAELREPVEAGLTRSPVVALEPVLAQVPEELPADGQFAGLIVYEDAGGRYAFTHAFIAEGYRGRGLSGVLMRGVLEDVKQRHITVTNYCPVLDRFIEKNPGYAPLIDSDNPGNWPKSGRNALGATRM